MTKKVLFLILTGILAFSLVLSCASTGGGQSAEAGGDPVLGVWEWQPEDDSNDKGTSTITMTEAEEVIDGQTVVTHTFSGEVTNATQYGLAQVTLTPDADTLALLRTAKAISFKMQADGRPYVIEAPISTVTDWGFHRYTIKTTAGAAEEFYIEMRMFMQPTWASPVRFNIERLTTLRIQTVNAAEGGTGPFEFKIWDVKLHP